MLGAPPVERRVALPEWPTPQEMKFWEVFTGLTSLRAHIWLHYYELVSDNTPKPETRCIYDIHRQGFEVIIMRI